MTPAAVQVEMLCVERSGMSVVIDATFTVSRGESVALVGPSGAGKSTLLQAIAGLLPTTSGEVVLAGVSMAGQADRVRAKLRLRRIGLVRQESDMVPELTIGENVELPLALIGLRRRETRSRALESLGLLGIAHLYSAKAGEVSGGEAQRAAVARSLVHQPALVLADEPTGALDSTNGKLVLNLMLEACSARGAALVLVTHDQHVAARCDRRLAVVDGHVYSATPGLNDESSRVSTSMAHLE